MNRIARTFAALLVAASLTTAVTVHTQAGTGKVVAGDHAWCC